MRDDGRISDAPFVSTLHTPHSAALHVGFSTIYASPKRIRISRVWGEAHGYFRDDAGYRIFQRAARRGIHSMLSAMGKVNDLIHLLGISHPTYASLKVGLQSWMRLRRNYFAVRFAIA